MTAGIGKSGLGSATPPGFVDPTAPTAFELRRRAIHTNCRAILDPTAAGGYGRLYGPNVDKNGNITTSEGLIPGWENISYADDGSVRKNVTPMVQVPDAFDPSNACIVTGTSSGSCAVCGAIGSSGEWGLKNGRAVACPDKGSGNGLHDLMTDQVGLVDGTRTSAALAGADSHFTASLSAAERASYNAAFRNRVAYKHAHSQQNPEADWGRNTLQAVVLAFYVPNESHANAPSGPRGGKRAVLDWRNTLVIVSSVSNGGSAALAAAEQDQHNLIDGVAVTEPNAQPITAENVPAIAADPVDTDRIVYAKKTLYVPDGCLRCRGEDASGIAIPPQSVATAAGSPASAGRNSCAGDGVCGSRRGWRAWRERRRRSRRRADSRART